MTSPYVNPSSYAGNMFESTPIAMRTDSACSACGVLAVEAVEYITALTETVPGTTYPLTKTCIFHKRPEITPCSD